MEVLNQYLAIRDEYPYKALKHTRVIALMGMKTTALTEWSLKVKLVSINSQHGKKQV